MAVLETSAVVLTGLVLIVLVTAVWFLFFTEGDSFTRKAPVQIEVKSGEGTAQIARKLASAGVIRNANAFRLRSRVRGVDGKLRVGVYDLETGMPDRTVIAALLSGPRIKYFTVTIPEGFVLEQIAERLSVKAGISKAEFLKTAQTGADRFTSKHPYLSDAYKGSLEGYLFPKTYRIRAGSSADEVIEMMLRQFDIEMKTIDTAESAARGLSFNQLVVLASMVERESKLDRERPLVASVIYNRLSRKMRLEIDATIEYVLPGNRFRLRNRDLRIDSPYNTYQRTGLPPGPISNPGLAALKAAASPADTAYLYYVLTGKDGSHTFAENEADFLVAKKKSKEVFGR